MNAHVSSRANMLMPIHTISFSVISTAASVVLPSDSSAVPEFDDSARDLTSQIPNVVRDCLFTKPALVNVVLHFSQITLDRCRASDVHSSAIG